MRQHLITAFLAALIVTSLSHTATAREYTKRDLLDVVRWVDNYARDIEDRSRGARLSFKNIATLRLITRCLQRHDVNACQAFMSKWSSNSRTRVSPEARAATHAVLAYQYLQRGDLTKAQNHADTAYSLHKYRAPRLMRGYVRQLQRKKAATAPPTAHQWQARVRAPATDAVISTVGYEPKRPTSIGDENTEVWKSRRWWIGEPHNCRFLVATQYGIVTRAQLPIQAQPHDVKSFIKWNGGCREYNTFLRKEPRAHGSGTLTYYFTDPLGGKPIAVASYEINRSTGLSFDRGAFKPVTGPGVQIGRTHCGRTQAITSLIIGPKMPIMFTAFLYTWSRYAADIVETKCKHRAQLILFYRRGSPSRPRAAVAFANARASGYYDPVDVTYTAERYPSNENINQIYLAALTKRHGLDALNSACGYACTIPWKADYFWLFVILGLFIYTFTAAVGVVGFVPDAIIPGVLCGLLMLVLLLPLDILDGFFTIRNPRDLGEVFVWVIGWPLFLISYAMIFVAVVVAVIFLPKSIYGLFALYHYLFVRHPVEKLFKEVVGGNRLDPAQLAVALKNDTVSIWDIFNPTFVYTHRAHRIKKATAGVKRQTDAFETRARGHS